MRQLRGGEKEQLKLASHSYTASLRCFAKNKSTNFSTEIELKQQGGRRFASLLAKLVKTLFYLVRGVVVAGRVVLGRVVGPEAEGADGGGAATPELLL